MCVVVYAYVYEYIESVECVLYRTCSVVFTATTTLEGKVGCGKAMDQFPIENTVHREHIL